MNNSKEYILSMHNYIYENIKFADYKASLLIAINAAAIGFILRFANEILEAQSNSLSIIFYIGASFFIISLIGAIIVIFPRQWKPLPNIDNANRIDLINHIAAHAKNNQTSLFVKKVMKEEKYSTTRHYLSDSFELTSDERPNNELSFLNIIAEKTIMHADVNHKKYYFLRISLICFLLALGFSFIFYIFTI